MFRKEARTLTKLHHAALVHYRVLAQEPQLRVLYIVTDFIEGTNLGDALGKLKPTPDELAGLLRRLASGLAAAHELGAVHRDMSPDNVILENGDVHQATIIDFGIAKDLDASSATIVGDGFAGKLNYVAPEQLGDFGREVGPWTDVYSLGLVILAVAQGKTVDMSRLAGRRDRQAPQGPGPVRGARQSAAAARGHAAARSQGAAALDGRGAARLARAAGRPDDPPSVRRRCRRQSPSDGPPAPEPAEYDYDCGAERRRRLEAAADRACRPAAARGGARRLVSHRRHVRLRRRRQQSASQTSSGSTGGAVRRPDEPPPGRDCARRDQLGAALGRLHLARHRAMSQAAPAGHRRAARRRRRRPGGARRDRPGAEPRRPRERDARFRRRRADHPGRLRRARHLSPGPRTAAGRISAGAAALRDDHASRAAPYAGQQARQRGDRLQFRAAPAGFRHARHRAVGEITPLLAGRDAFEQARSPVGGRPDQPTRATAATGSTSTSTTNGWSGIMLITGTRPFDAAWSRRRRRARARLAASNSSPPRARGNWQGEMVWYPAPPGPAAGLSPGVQARPAAGAHRPCGTPSRRPP